MKTTVVPAQITTVEDKIAGSLTLPQIVLLVMAMVIGAGIYAVVIPKMHFGEIKITLIAIEFIFFGGLALRFNGKILGEWLVIYLRYNSRPRKYIFTKNDPIQREIIYNSQNSESKQNQIERAESTQKEDKPLSLLEELNMQKLYYTDSLSVSFKPSKKGGLDVSLKAKD